MISTPPFQDNAARLVKFGCPEISAGGKTTFEDEYAFKLPSLSRPAPSAITGLPSIGDNPTGLPGFIATKISFAQTDATSLVWTARVLYEAGSTASAADGGHSDFDKRWGIRSVMADFVMDANTGAAVVNSADEPFDSVPQREMLLPALSWRRISTVAPASLMEYNGSVNSDQVAVLGVTFEAHCARIRFEASKIEDGSGANRYEYQFYVDGATNLYKPSTEDSGDPEDIGWDSSFLDCGFTCYDDETGERRVILVEDEDGNKSRPSMPQLLCGGSWLQERGNAYFLKFAPYPAKSWSALKLPAS